MINFRHKIFTWLKAMEGKHPLFLYQAMLQIYSAGWHSLQVYQQLLNAWRDSPTWRK